MVEENQLFVHTKLLQNNLLLIDKSLKIQSINMLRIIIRMAARGLAVPGQRAAQRNES